MSDEGLEKFFRSEIGELEENIAWSRAARPFVDHDPQSHLLDMYVSAIHALIERSESVSELVDDFLESDQVDRDLVDRAKTVVKLAKNEIARFREQKDFAAFDISDETEKLQ